MFNEQEKLNRWSLFELLPMSKQIQIHNLILVSAQRIVPANNSQNAVKKAPELRLIRVK